MKIHQKQISAYERGRNTPSTEVLIKLADIFDVSLDYLAFEAEGQSAKVNIKDRELLRRFEEIDKLSEKDKGRQGHHQGDSGYLYPEKQISKPGCT